jgi:hypothetical protein
MRRKTTLFDSNANVLMIIIFTYRNFFDNELVIDFIYTSINITSNAFIEDIQVSFVTVNMHGPYRLC